MRLDYYHTGDAAQEVFSVDRVVIEPLPWPGDPAQAIDSSNLGKYLFEIRDCKDEATAVFARVCVDLRRVGNDRRSEDDEAHVSGVAALPCSGSASQRRPEEARREERLSGHLDHDDRSGGPVCRSIEARAPAPLITIQKTGEPETRVDFLILGDGYTAAEAKKFEADARRLTETLFATSPFKENRKSFNVWALSPPAAESGVSRPSTGIYRDSPIGATYDAFGSERYVLTFDNRALRKAAQFAPYEFIEVLVNNRTYGGGGIFNLYSTVAADNAFADYVFVHEFGHHFAALADEYYTSSVAYAPAQRIELNHGNRTSLHCWMSAR